jgi:hypothetical protein
MEATQTTSELLHHRKVFDLRTDVVPVIGDSTVFTCDAKGLSTLILKLINNLYFSSLRVQPIAISL